MLNVIREFKFEEFLDFFDNFRNDMVKIILDEGIEVGFINLDDKPEYCILREARCSLCGKRKDEYLYFKFDTEKQLNEFKNNVDKYMEDADGFLIEWKDEKSKSIFLFEDRFNNNYFESEITKEEHLLFLCVECDIKFFLLFLTGNFKHDNSQKLPIKFYHGCFESPNKKYHPNYGIH